MSAAAMQLRLLSGLLLIGLAAGCERQPDPPPAAPAAAAPDRAPAASTLEESARRAARNAADAAAEIGREVGDASRRIATDAAAVARGASQVAVETLDDAAITARVKSLYATDAGVPASTIDVDTTERRVVLRGRVENREQAERALELARGIEGVRDVEDQLVVGAR